MDMREHDVQYMVYVDGAGLMAGERHSFYCYACKDMNTPQHSSRQHAALMNDDALTSQRARAIANAQRVFGTRDEIEDLDYQSPLSEKDRKIDSAFMLTF